MLQFRGGLPPGWRVVGLHQIDGMPHTNHTVQDRAKAMVAAEKVVAKHLTQTQMLRSRADCRQGPRPKSLPDLHQFVHQRLCTTMDIPGPNPKIRPDHGPMCTSRWVLLPTADQKVRGSSPFGRAIILSNVPALTSSEAGEEDRI